MAILALLLIASNADHFAGLSELLTRFRLRGRIPSKVG